MRLLLAPVLSLALLVPGLVGTPAQATDLTQMTEAERDAFGAEVRAYLLAHPEVMIEVQQALESQQQQQADARDAHVLSRYKAEIYNDPASWVGGNPDGDITVVEFMDYRCSYCRKASEEVEDLVKSDGNVRLVLKEYPILGDDSVTSSRFAIAVRLLNGDEAYKKAHDALITLRGTPDAETLSRLATDLGFDATAILDKMGSDEVTGIIVANRQMGDILGVSGTPTFILGDTVIRGYLPEADMKQIIEMERAS
jgi:protein-disulfide isomerase